ncbi:FecCD family ABC transporter permease [Gemmatimonas sp.]|jgi:iron complex transport system permease protein|uniref:FecCD family ABC transporter permease n=1 Tax=Gemmatimonas sp. TaxID=1962908 RepID=UPI0037C06C93
MASPGVAWGIGAFLLVLVVVLGLTIGAVPIAARDILDALRGLGDPSTIAIVRDLRAPRVLLAALVGAGLASSGGALQGTLRNPLAEPYLLGVSGGAAVGAVTAMAFGVVQPALVTACAFVGAAIATVVVTAIARVVGGSADTKLLLMAGVVVGAFANAAILVALADAPPERLRGALFWMMGSAADATWPAVARCAAALLLLGGILVWRARDLDVLSLGDEPAAALGVDVDRVSRQLFLVASWLAAATVAAAGLIGFVGLVVPNIARALGARQHRPMLLLSALYGAVLLVAADLLARTLRAPADLPLGAVTALVGVPFFLLRLRRLAA